MADNASFVAQDSVPAVSIDAAEATKGADVPTFAMVGGFSGSSALLEQG